MHILYATDGSDEALAGARLIDALPLSEKSRIDVLTVVERDGEEDPAALARTMEALGGSGACLYPHTRQGNAADEILAAAEEISPSLIVVGTRGRSAVARFLLGSVAERVVRHSPCPVLLARPLQGALNSVILGTDHSEHADRAAEWLARFPLPPKCEIRLVSVVTPPTSVSSSRMMAVSSVANTLITLAEQEKEEAAARLETLAASFSAAGKRATTVVRPDEPAQGLIDYAGEIKADLIVVGAQGLSAIDRFLIGSVSERVLRYAPCSVLVVR